MSALRFIKRDGKMILQQEIPGPFYEEEQRWQDVPVHEEPKEPEYVIDNGQGLGLRLIDERLVDQLVDELENFARNKNASAIFALARYRKHVPK